MNEKRRRPRQVAFGLSDRRLFHQGIDVVRHNLQNQVELAQRFGETPHRDVELGVSCKQIRITWIQSLGFDEVGLALFPLPPIARDKGE